jgi:hypothetical protein
MTDSSIEKKGGGRAGPKDQRGYSIVSPSNAPFQVPDMKSTISNEQLDAVPDNR